jgi:tRNA pseudouridine55 synthase
MIRSATIAVGGEEDSSTMLERKSPLGFLCVDKPAGMTSAHVVNRVKRLLGLTRKSKIGHMGTLDPDATGVLVCAVGRATRLIPFLSGGRKVYTGELQLGLTTSTDDVSGEIVSRFTGSFPESETVLSATKEYRGNILQRPPTISAVKIQGERAYVRARRGEDIEIKPKEVVVYDFEVAPVSPERYSYRVECGPGTYVRSLVRDLGESVGTGGVVVSIRREMAFPFHIDLSTPLENIASSHLIPWYEVFGETPEVSISRGSANRLFHGDSSDALREVRGLLKGAHEQGTYARLCLGSEKTPVGLLAYESGSWKVIFVDFDVIEEC